MNDDRESLIVTEIGIREAAAILDVHENTVRNWIADGRLKARPMLGRSGFRRLERREVELYASARRDAALSCATCGYRTTREEARLRRFNTGRCGRDNGELLTQEQVWIAGRPS